METLFCVCGGRGGEGEGLAKGLRDETVGYRARTVPQEPQF